MRSRPYSRVEQAKAVFQAVPLIKWSRWTGFSRNGRNITSKNKTKLIWKSKNSKKSSKNCSDSMLYYLFLDYGSKLFNLNIFW